MPAVKAAIRLIGEGQSERDAAKAVGMSRSSPQRYRCILKEEGKLPEASLKPGKKPVFTAAEEGELTDYLIKSSKMFYGLGLEQTCKLALEQTRKLAFDYAQSLLGKKIPSEWIRDGLPSTYKPPKSFLIIWRQFKVSISLSPTKFSTWMKLVS